MTRFNITLKQGVEVVKNILIDSVGGEIVVPKIPSYHILDLVKAIDSKGRFKITGIRPGEKIHEILCSEDESKFIYEHKDSFEIWLFDSSLKPLIIGIAYLLR